MPRFVFRLLLVAACVAVFATACGHKPPVLTINLRGDAVLNPDPGGASLPVVVYLYQLKRRDKFEQADFRALWKSPGDALGGDLVESQEITLRPGEAREIQIRRNLDTRFLGVVALFREPEGDRWRRVLPLDEKKRKQAVRLSLRGSQVEMDATTSGWFGFGSKSEGK
ncbi:MAG: type VI secretion system lipoprotein TssJ [Nitrospirota bacterium]